MSGIVVGVDGSDGSKPALEWAAAEARTRELPLTAVYAWSAPATLYAGLGWVPADTEVLVDLRKLAERRLAEVCEELGPALADVQVERKVVEGPAANALLAAAEDADLLVVGTRGHGGFTGLLLGSVSQQCAHHCPCPIVIVPLQPER
ncbi:MAG TPA: universal stress protein [Gaiellaceae bacterium]|nr:universal stress protein [Gaiellaceae bacterium]